MIEIVIAIIIFEFACVLFLAWQLHKAREERDRARRGYACDIRGRSTTSGTAATITSAVASGPK